MRKQMSLDNSQWTTRPSADVTRRLESNVSTDPSFISPLWDGEGNCIPGPYAGAEPDPHGLTDMSKSPSSKKRPVLRGSERKPAGKWTTRTVSTPLKKWAKPESVGPVSVDSWGEPTRRTLQRLFESGPQPSFHNQKLNYAESHLLSLSTRLRLHKSPVLMNHSGRFVHMVYHDAVFGANRAFKKRVYRHLVVPMPLVLVYDDLELPLGKLKLRAWDSSPKGHNGVRSVQKAFQKLAVQPTWYRLSIGIGRPGERDHEAVTDWVLRALTREEHCVFNFIGLKMLALLEDIEDDVQRRITGMFPPGTKEIVERETEAVA